MEIHSGVYVVEDILDLSSKTVPRGVFKGADSEFALDYHSGLLPIAKLDTVRFALYMEKPSIPPTVYLMRGLVYKIEENRFEASFGGLLLLFQGPLNERLSEDAEIFLSLLVV